MRLEKIKLAGFKSFVDPTTVPIPSNLVGIVGPNGCGKSNVIDAVRVITSYSIHYTKLYEYTGAFPVGDQDFS